jgi:hypothetical protein
MGGGGGGSVSSTRGIFQSVTVAMAGSTTVQIGARGVSTAAYASAGGDPAVVYRSGRSVATNATGNGSAVISTGRSEAGILVATARGNTTATGVKSLTPGIPPGHYDPEGPGHWDDDEPGHYEPVGPGHYVFD